LKDGTDREAQESVRIRFGEFTHIMQFQHAWQETGRRPELHADCVSGWSLSLRGRWGWGTLGAALRVLYQIGDYQFNSPNHHGTPDERLNAANTGFFF
jgi:hypothetical protein